MRAPAHRHGPGRRASGKAGTLALMAVVAVAALAAGVYVALEQTRLEPADRTAVSALTRMKLPDLQGEERSIDQWHGKVVVVNFWATWCPPCRQEIPGLIKIQQKHAANGVQVVGIAVDQADKVKAYATEIGMRYPTLVAGIDVMDVARKLGNKSGALPFTVVLDRQGNIVKTHLGILTEAELDALLAPLLG